MSGRARALAAQLLVAAGGQVEEKHRYYSILNGDEDKDMRGMCISLNQMENWKSLDERLSDILKKYANEEHGSYCYDRAGIEAVISEITSVPCA